MRTAHLLIWLQAVFLSVVVNSALAQSTVFSYQGSLKTGGLAANGSYDFRFRLSTDPLGSTYVAKPCFASGVVVTDGLFMTLIDFGTGVFTGDNYWLEVAVRTNAALTEYTVLKPLQYIASTPYAMFAGAAHNINGTIGVAQLPTTVVTNGAKGIGLSGVFGGDGSALTNVFSPTQSDYLFAYANAGVPSTGTYSTFRYVIGPGTNISFNSLGASNGWSTATSRAGQTFVAAHKGVYWIQYSVNDTYQQGGGFPHFQATTNGVAIAGSQCTPIMQGSTSTSFIAGINAGDRLGIQCTA